MLTVERIMQAKPRTVPPDMPLLQLDQLFLTEEVSGFPVVQEDRLVGVISRSDIVRSLATERSRVEQLSGFHHVLDEFTPDESMQSLDEIAAQVGVRFAELTVEDAMVRNVVTVEYSEPLKRLAEIMVEGHLHRIPVVNGGRLVGLVTTIDLARAIAEGLLVEAPEVGESEPLLTG